MPTNTGQNSGQDSDTLGLGPEWSEHTPSINTQPPGWEDEPPPMEEPPPSEEDYHFVDAPHTEEAPEDTHSTRHSRDSYRASAGHIDDVLSGLVAELHGADSDKVSTTLGRVRAAGSVWDHMAPKQRKLWEGVLEVIDFEVTSIEGVGTIDFEYLPASRSRQPEVAEKLRKLQARREAGDVLHNAAGEFDQLIEDVAGASFVDYGSILINMIKKGSNAKDKMDVFRKLRAPTYQRSIRNKPWSKTAAEWDDEARAAEGNLASDMAISFGMPSLEAALSGDSPLRGAICPSEFWVIAAGTGHGKSSFARVVATAAAWDVVNGYGFSKAKVLYMHTEEESIDIAQAMKLRRGQAFHDLADHVVISKVGQSRSRLVETLYDSIADAIRASTTSGAPLRDFLPYVVFCDYVQGIHEPGENPDNDGVARTADLLMRGFAACDPDMIAQITGIDFRSYTGLDWPKELDTHRIAVVGFAQLRKEANDHTVFYREGRSSIADFTVINENGVPCWIPQENDYCIPKRSDIRGSGVLLQHATGLFFLHRRQPEAAQIRDANGKVIGLSNEVAELIIPKARKGVGAPYVPMRFGPNSEGFRAQWYDVLAEQHAVGRMELADCYRQPGDPMIPVRPKRSPFTGIRY